MITTGWSVMSDGEHLTTILRWWEGSRQHRIQILSDSVVRDTRDEGGPWARQDEWDISEWDEPLFGKAVSEKPSDHTEADVHA